MTIENKTVYILIYRICALGWYIPSVGVPRDVGCRTLVVYAANLFSVQFSSPQIKCVYTLAV